MLSITGGLLNVASPLDEGIKVELIFHVGESTVRSKARMLFPMWATQGYLQPFEFSGLNEQERYSLETDLQRLLDCSAAKIVSSEDENAEMWRPSEQS